MRIRQVRPEFFTDSVVATLAADVRLTYIGLWCVADDAGWMTWDVAQIAAQLYPYESIRVRTGRVARAGDALVGAGRLVMHPCGCALIPKLPDHQRIGGNKAFPARDRHREHVKSVRVHTDMDLSAGKVSNGRVGNVTVETRASATEEDPLLMAAYRRQGLPVDVA